MLLSHTGSNVRITFTDFTPLTLATCWFTSSTKEILKVEKEIVLTLKNIYDPEIPVNIYDLGLIYEID